jgi:hypothetical protein
MVKAVYVGFFNHLSVPYKLIIFVLKEDSRVNLGFLVMVIVGVPKVNLESGKKLTTCV